VTICFDRQDDLRAFYQAVPKINAANHAQPVLLPLKPAASLSIKDINTSQLANQAPKSSEFKRGGSSRLSRGQSLQGRAANGARGAMDQGRAAGGARGASERRLPNHLPPHHLSGSEPRKSARTNSSERKNFVEEEDDSDGNFEITGQSSAGSRSQGRATRNSSDSALMALPQVSRPCFPFPLSTPL
jgi:hypothetical protein